MEPSDKETDCNSGKSSSKKKTTTARTNAPKRDRKSHSLSISTNTLQNTAHLPPLVITAIENAEKKSVTERNTTKPLPKKPAYKPTTFNPSMQPHLTDSTSITSPSSLSNGFSFSSPMSSFSSPTSARSKPKTASQIKAMFDAREQEEDDDGESSDEENAEGFINNNNCVDDNNSPTVDSIQEDSGGVDANNTSASTSTSSATDVLDKWKYLRETLNMFVFNNGEPANPADIKTFIPDDFNPSNDTTTAFNNADNPGNWPAYCYTAKQVRGQGYVYHRLPGGATPVPATEEFNGPIRTIGGCKIYYGGSEGTWGVNPDTDTFFSRSNATPINLLPKERRTVLDCEKLKKYGVNMDRISSDDALFFLQLLLPLTDTNSKGGINEYSEDQQKRLVVDERKPYYNEVATFSSANMQSWCGNADTCHTSTKLFSSKEQIQFDGITISNGNVGGGHNYHNLWNPDDDKYSRYVDRCSLKPTRFLEVKKYRKYNNNRKETLL